jgi:hypothetical protein
MLTVKVARDRMRATISAISSRQSHAIVMPFVCVQNSASGITSQ